jgi:hypothetical protein
MPGLWQICSCWIASLAFGPTKAGVYVAFGKHNRNIGEDRFFNPLSAILYIKTDINLLHGIVSDSAYFLILDTEFINRYELMVCPKNRLYPISAGI